MKVLTNDLKKGTRILLNSGFYATLLDNKKGNIRLADVEGLYREMGSIYSHDIKKALLNNSWVDIDYTDSQIDLRLISGGF